MNASPMRGLSDVVNDEQAILSDIAGGRARARALQLPVVSGIMSRRSVITWLPGRAVVIDTSVQDHHSEDPENYLHEVEITELQTAKLAGVNCHDFDHRSEYYT